METKELIPLLESGKLPKNQWDHFTHLQLPLYYIFNRLTEYEVITKVRCTLIRYGTLTTEEFICPIKYHETITIFWISEIKKFVELNPNMTLTELEIAIKKSDLMDKNYIFKFYSEAILNSAKARAFYVESDV